MNKKIISNVFLWMFVGLLITFGTAFLVSNNYNMVRNIFSGWVYYVLIFLELGLAMFLSIRVWKMSGATATCVYLFYTFLTGLTMSSIFIRYELMSIIFVFLVASILFLIFALIGKFTKIDLSKFSVFLFMAVIGVILLNVINMFLLNSTLNLISCIFGLIVFLAYVAFDIQRIKRYSSYNLPERNLAIISALSIYIDFINIFMDLLNLSGRSRR